VARFDPGAGANRLDTVRVSRASAEQRSGRAGRLGPGTAYRLWSQEAQGRLVAHDAPEILSTDLSRCALELAAWGVAPDKLRLLDAPPTAHWQQALALLRGFGALDAQGRITAQGRALTRLPTAPRLAHLLMTAQALGAGEAACWLAAALEEREAEGGSDLAERVERLRAGRGDPAQQRRVRETVKQFERLLERQPAGASTADEDLALLTAMAYPERIAQRREGLREAASGPRGSREVAYLCADGGEARLPEHDPLARSPWLAIAHWDATTPRRIRLAAALDERALRQQFAERLKPQTVVRWDAQSEAVLAETQERLGEIVLAARPLRGDHAPAEAVRAALIEGIARTGLHVLPWTPAAREWLSRVLSLRHWQADAGWPDVSDTALLATLADWLAPFLDGCARRSHLYRVDVMGALNAMLDYPQQQALLRLAPTHLTVPSGNRHALAYTPGQAPALEVKLQEMFGTPDTPTVCDGRVKVVLHLLSPGRKPIAVTGDLTSFWARSYFEVKKDLRGRYPRHPWSDDPLAAQATARAKPRGT
jgi:ATP-dependent helicase HrpB